MPVSSDNYSNLGCGDGGRDGIDHTGECKRI